MNPTYAFISDEIQWGNAPSWAAFIVATIAASLAYGAFLREQRRDLINSEIRLREQANKVAAWWDPTQVDGYHVVIRNASELPVEDVEVIASYVEEVTHSYKTNRSALPFTLTHTGPHIYLDASGAPVLPPGESLVVELEISREEAPEVSLVLSFRDAQGVQWKRSGGELVANEEKPQPIWFRPFTGESAYRLAKPIVATVVVTIGLTQIVREMFFN